MDESGATDQSAEPSLVPDAGEQALRCLISDTIPKGKLALFIKLIFSSKKATDAVSCLRGSDAQAFVDVVDGVCYHSSTPGNGLTDFDLHLLYPNRPWRDSILRKRSERNV